MGTLGAAAAVSRDLTCILQLPPHLLQPVIDEPGLSLSSVLLRADLCTDRALTALVARDLTARGLRVGVSKRPLGRVASRLASFGVLPAREGAALPARLVDRLLRDAPSHS